MVMESPGFIKSSWTGLVAMMDGETEGNSNGLALHFGGTAMRKQ